MFLSRIVLTFVALYLPAITANAEVCGPLRKIASLDMTSLPSGQVTVPVGINGKTEQFLLSTAGGLSTLGQLAIARLGLKSMDVDRGPRLINSNGNASRRKVTINEFSLGGIQGKNIDLMVDTRPNLGSNANLLVAGSLANDLMEDHDFDLDFDAGKLNYFSTDHCDGHVVYWTNAAPAVLEYRSARPGANAPLDSHIRFHVTVDGKDILAVLSTEATTSTMTAQAARALYDLTINSPNTVPLGTPDGDPKHRAFGYVFKSLAFGGVAVTNPRFRIIPVVIGEHDPDNGFIAGSHIIKVDDNREADVTIGMDVLRKLHVYVAQQEHKLYITGAAAPSGQQVAKPEDVH